MRETGGAAGILAAIVIALAMSGVAGAREPGREDLVKALKAEWRDQTPCSLTNVCSMYFDSFGVALLFADGSTRPFEHEQRQAASAHDCLAKARNFLLEGDRTRAVEWAMAAQRSAPLRDWMREHPDEVVDLLNGCCLPLPR
jgi:hypothetical protein